MSRPVLILLVVLVVIVGGAVLLSRSAHERPTHTIEKAVPIANLQG